MLLREIGRDVDAGKANPRRKRITKKNGRCTHLKRYASPQLRASLIKGGCYVNLKRGVGLARASTKLLLTLNRFKESRNMIPKVKKITEIDGACMRQADLCIETT